MSDNTYKPTAAMASAARKAIKFKEDGKPTDTLVGHKLSSLRR